VRDRILPRMTHASRHWAAALLLLASAAASAQDEPFHVWELSLLSGNRYALGDENRQIVTLEYFGEHRYGVNTFFFDFTDPFENSSDTYFEGYTFFSYEKVSGKGLSLGPLTDVSLGLGLNQGQDFTALLIGPSWSFDVPGFDYLSLDTFVFDDRSNPEKTLAITPAWGLSFQLGRLPMKFRGFVTYYPREGPSAYYINAQPQLLADIGALFGDRDHLFAGVEYLVSRNKFGIRGEHEYVPQAMVLYAFYP
jgi:hypothetical protein